MLEQIKSKLSYVVLGVLGFLGLLLGFKLKRLATLEAEKKAQDLEKDVQAVRDMIVTRRKEANDAEKDLRSKEAELKHAIRMARDNNGSGNA